ncbi:MAG: cytochrome c3 family protein [bacterium]|nr:MAG: cytochrome c3 family protein [bacterium]
MEKMRPFLYVLVLLVAVIGFVTLRGENIKQPLQYNHKKHVEDAGLGCPDCHQYVENLAAAGMPRTSTCLECHAEALTEGTEEQKFLELAANGNEIRWQPVYKMPADVYFSHQRHVTIAEIECETCHGNIAELTTPPKRPAVKLSMKYCMKCHEEMKADNDCLACHK